MNILYKVLFSSVLFVSAVHAGNSFKTYSDMCETADEQECVNHLDEIRNLQIVLNSDKSIVEKIDMDGKWGDKTKLAVMVFQKEHNIVPAQGYVGAKTKKVLDAVSEKITLPKVKIANSSSFSGGANCYVDFKKCTNLKKSFKVFKDKKLLSKANGRNTHIKIDVGDQRVRLFVNGKVALDSPCTTGAKRKFEPNTKIYRDKHTPLGTFKITEKIADKRSTIFGDMFRNGKRVYHGDRRKYKGPKAKYVGASLKNWMRLTSSGIGLHASKYIKRYPGTNGCIRLPYKVAHTIFSKVKRGTKVSVVR